MSNIRVGDTVAFRRSVAQKCNAPEIAEFRWVSSRDIAASLRTYGVTRHALNLLESR